MNPKDNLHQIAIQSSQIGIWQYHISEGRVFFSDTWFSMLGLQKEDYPQILDTYYQLVHPDYRKEISVILDNFIHSRDENNITFEFRMKSIENSWKWISCKLSVTGRDQQGVISEILGTHYDISQIKEKEFDSIAQVNNLEVQLNRMSTVHWQGDENGKILFVTPNILDLSGFTKRELINRNLDFWLERVHDDDRSMVLEKLTGLFNKNHLYSAEYRFQHKQGHWIWLNDQAVMVSHENGTKKAQGLLAEITDRKRTEELLRESEKKYHSLMDQIPVGILLSQNMVIKYCNPEISRIFGYDYEEMIDKCILDFIEENYWEQVKKREYELTQKNTRGSSKRFHILRKDKRIAHIISDTIYTEYDNAPAILSVVKDITHQVKAEEELKKQQEQLTLAIHSTGIAICEFYLKEDSIYYSSEIWKILGYTNDACTLSIEQWLEYIHPEDREGYIDMLKLMKGYAKSETTIEYRVKSCANQWIWLQSINKVSSQMSRNSSGRWMGIVQNITTQKNNALELKIKEHLLLRTQQMATLGGLTSAMAHEIRQPLNLIKIVSDTLSYSFSLPLEKQYSKEILVEKLHEISMGVDRINHTITNLKDLFNTSKDVQREMADINGVIQTSISFFEQRLKQHNIALDVELDGAIPPINISVIQVQEVFNNLLNNSIHVLKNYEPSNGDKKRVIIRTISQEDILQICFRDNGPGIPSENQKAVFDPFYSTKREQGGMGMGLYIVKKIMEEMKGRIYMNPQYLKGAEFIMEFPQ